MRVDNMMMDLLSYGDSYKSFITGSQHNYPITDVVNFRKIINPEYKANRKDLVAPQWLDMCRKYLIEEYNTEVCIGYEADDALGFNQTEETVICSIDKDLKQIEGAHYNFVTKQYSEVSYLDGLRSVYRQALIGDTSDNIKGVAGLGKVKAAKIIDPLESEFDMFNTVKSLYSDDMRFFLNMNCLWIWHQENEKYTDRDWVREVIPK
jgi:5'-3' exonuclease